ncbi:uncharacterized protein NPIL_128481 [Nephila pilipes]|uniref:Retrotransposon gag domain-containing protein n=1 Tax=Nephila pilipes TaxID=299642 RepID=A0A8X6MAZ5_NEPPI|nr:uncharacterized protein NPIL_128481 [Nephila pilipes]
MGGVVYKVWAHAQNSPLVTCLSVWTVMHLCHLLAFRYAQGIVFINLIISQQHFSAYLRGNKFPNFQLFSATDDHGYGLNRYEQEMISSVNSSKSSTPTPREDLHSSCILRKQIEKELKTYTDSIDHCQTLIRNLERQGFFDHPIYTTQCAMTQGFMKQREQLTNENVLEFLDSIDYGVLFHEIPTNLACAYLKGHLIGRAKDWFEVIDSSYVTETPTDFAQLNQALTNSFPVVRNRSELEAEFYSSHQVRIQAPSDFVYKLLKIQKILNFEMTEENLLNCILMRLSPQIMDYVEVRNPTTKAQLVQLVEKYEERHRRNTKNQQDKWAKYYNNRRREVKVKIKDLVLVQTHPMSSASKRIVSKFKRKFEGPYEVMKVENNNVVI